MKNIAVILPINNPDILNQQDLDQYNTDQVQVRLIYPKTHLQELKTQQDVAEVLPLVEQAIIKAIQHQVDSIVMCGFGDICIQASNEFDDISKVGAGRITVRALESISKKKFTILPGDLSHLSFIEAVVRDEQCTKYMAAPKATDLDPKEYKTHPQALESIVAAAKEAIELCDVDALSIGCAGFQNLAAEVEQVLKARYQYDVNVLEPLDTALQYEIYRLTKVSKAQSNE